METLVKAWRGWKRFAHAFARVQTVILISGFYLLVIAPLGGILRLFGWDPLVSRRRHTRTSNWKAVAESEPSSASLHRQS